VARLGVIAGGGALPGQVISACRETGRDYFVLAFEGSADPEVLGDAPVQWIRMSGLSKAFEIARREGVEELVLVGKIPRPSILELMRDVRSAKFLAKVGTRMLGDDNILSAVVREIEETEGFRVIGPEVLLDNILATAGCYGAIEPNDHEMADIRRGMEVLRTMGPLDIGQGVVVQNGMIIGVEAAEGTDRLIERCAEFMDPETVGGVFVKAAKPTQDRRIDRPAVGSSTMNHAIQAGLRGIAIEAGGALVVDRQVMIDAADAAGVFLFGISSD
jgi:UDP-2,3-diacylglucosamine hydrolase